MTKSIFTTLLITVLLASCKQEPDAMKLSLPPKQTPKKENILVGDTTNYEKRVRQFSMIYQYTEGDDDNKSNQMLGITFLKNHRVDFYLFSKTLPCNTAYWGVAKCEFWNSDPETDEDENGLYPSREYTIERDEYELILRIAVDSMKVIVKYVQKDSLDTDCLPITDVIMKRIK